MTNDWIDTAARHALPGRYVVESVIGDGATARVYRARDQVLERAVAVKLFRHGVANAEQAALQQAEARMLARFSHHALVTLLDAGTIVDERGETHLFLVMEWMEGADLRAQMHGSPLPRREVAGIGYDVAEALRYVHARGVLHRDIKPANVLVRRYDDGSRLHGKLTDFGLAQIDGAGHTTEGHVKGTAAYLSPEQVRAEQLTPASDVYALGLVLLEALTGVLEYPGGLVESAVARLTRRPTVPDSLPDHWRHLLEGMTAFDPADRPALTDVVRSLGEMWLQETARHRDASRALVPVNETGRLSALRRYQLTEGTPGGDNFDRITSLAARIFDVPMAFVSIVDSERIWYAAAHGVDGLPDAIGRDPGLCASAILQEHAWIVEDARRDPRTITNPLVAGEFGLQFYVGVPLHTSDGYNLGTLCVVDFAPRPVSVAATDMLRDLGALLVSDLELRLDARRARETVALAGAVPALPVGASPSQPELPEPEQPAA